MSTCDGVLVIDKPSGPTSHDVVARLRDLAATKAGHLGTLDPFATGVLPVALGRATRLIRFLAKGERGYRATLQFGQATDTGDLTGHMLGPVQAPPSREALLTVLPSFRGLILQRPHAYSAKKVAGVRAYKLARRGTEVVLDTVPVTIARLDLVAFEPPTAELEVSCSAGTYVRSLGADLAVAAGSAAHLTALRRLRCGPFDLGQAVDLAALDDGSWLAHVLPLARLPFAFATLALDADAAQRFCHGRAVPVSPEPASEFVGVCSHDGRFLGVARVDTTPAAGSMLLPEVVVGGLSHDLADAL